MSIFLMIVLAALTESLVSFAGGVLAFFNAERIRKLAHFVVSFAVGALLAVSLLELIPEAAEESTLSTIMPVVFLGIVVFFILEKFLFWYHCHDGKCPVHTYTYLILWGDVLHNFIDGVIIALTFMADIRLGIMTTIAVIFHEIPQEIGDFGTLLHGGFSRAKALLYNFLVSLSTIVGALLAFAFGSFLEPFIPIALALIAGNFIYLAVGDLMPELHESAKLSHSVAQIAFIIMGALLVIAPEFFFAGH